MIIADENVEKFWIDLLRNNDYELISIQEQYSGISDRDVIEIVKKEKGILITEDKDFGELVFSYGFKEVSVILLRYDQPQYEQIKNSLLEVIREYYEQSEFLFITITKNKVRIRKI